MNNIVYKRIMAILIDLLIVSLLSGLLSSIKFLNPYASKYEEASEKYLEYSEEMLSSPEKMTYDNLFSDEFISYYYDVSKYGFCYAAIEVVVAIFYFTLFPYFNKNKTTGKDIFHITTKDASFGKLLLKSLFLPVSASLILYNPIGSFLILPSLFILSKRAYVYFYLIFSIIITIFCYIDIIFMFVRSDHKSLHDLITNTNVDNI